MIGRVLRVTFLAATTAYFALPLVMTVVFSLSEGRLGYGPGAYLRILARADLLASLRLSCLLALATIAVIVLIMVPAVVAMHLIVPRLRGLFETIAVLPFVIPGIALVAGLSALIRAPLWFVGSPVFLVLPYFVLALPYAYRAIDVALDALDLPHLRQAASSLGADMRQTILWVVLPNLWPALVNAALMTFTVVLGEFTVANILLFPTFPVALNLVGKSSPTDAAALSVVSFAITWAALLGVLILSRDRRSSARSLSEVKSCP
jgi:putative spermidine/putrescine transport system permease protein